MNEYRQTIIEKRNTEETQTDFPEICHSFSFVNVEEILLKSLKSRGRSLNMRHVKCELLDMNSKMKSLINGAANGFP